MGNKVKISADCICDLPRRMWDDLNLSIMYFYIETEEGRFQDITELNSECIIEYLEEGKQAKSFIASVDEYKSYFENIQAKHDGPLIHICASKYVSESYAAAVKAASSLENIYIFDSEQLSGGMGIMVLTAAEMAMAGASYELILNELELLRPKIFTSFVVDTMDHLYRNQKVGKWVVRICDFLTLHPIIKIKDGNMKVSGFCMGDASFYAKFYVRSMLKRIETIDNTTVFIVSAGCSFEFIELLKTEIQKRVKWKKIIVTNASATVTSNCGPGTFGILFSRK